MRRRELVVGIGAAVLMPPLGVPAQQLKKLPRIGFLATGRFQGRMIDAFRQGLGELGYAEGTNFTLEYRQAESRVERFPALAQELVDLKVDLIVAMQCPDGEAMFRNACRMGLEGIVSKRVDRAYRSGP